MSGSEPGLSARDFDPAGSPLRVFGAELRYYRTKTGLSQEQLGSRVFCSGDLVGKVENGQRTPTRDFTAACDAVSDLDTRGALMRLWEHLQEHFTYKATPGWFHVWAGIERRATALRSWEPLLIPGLLQTPDYAREVFRRGLPNDSDGGIDDRVSARMERQQILDRDDPPLLLAVIDEGALRRVVGTPPVMRDQLGHLLKMAERQKVMLQVVPLDAGPHPGMAGPIMIASCDGVPDVAYLDTAMEGQLVERPDDVAAVDVLFDSLRTEALPGRASAKLIAEVMET
jgi:transcriptional regulator with XRE-family HTH domain